MTTDIKTIGTRHTGRRLRTVAIVSAHPHPQVLETVLESSEHDVVFIESIAHAYSQIKRVTPDLIVVCLSGNDADQGCQVLSMLTLDRETSSIPVVTCMTPASAGYAGEPAESHDAFGRLVPVSLN
jgi:CheY-like chemotaxis protein